MKKNFSVNSRVIAICLVLAAVLAVVIIPPVSDYLRANKAYKEAERLIAGESYQEAYEILEGIKAKDIKDTDALMSLCMAYNLYDAGKIPDAYFELNCAEFKHQTEEQLEEIEIFRRLLNREYDAYIADKVKKDEEAYRNKIRYGVPFVGMSEDEIGNTSLGAPMPEVRHNSEMIGGKVYQANLYDFKSGSETIFTARCVRGKVTDVWDKRNKPQSTYTPSTPKKTENDDDPYNAKDYYDAEDFYDDYYDDFYEYEEAEEYYNEHGMW